MTTAKRALLMLLQLAFLYAFIACVAVFDPDRFLLRAASNLFLMMFSLALMISFADRIIEPHTRRYMVSIAGLITLWIVLRGAKYIAFEETEIVARHIWYLYYLPALLIPFLSLLAALSVGTKNWIAPRRKDFPAGLAQSSKGYRLEGCRWGGALTARKSS